MTNIVTGLNELLGAERELWRAWGRASVMASNGMLTADVRDRYNGLRDQLLSIERTIYDVLVAPLRPLGLEDQIPVPSALPDLPIANARPPVSTAGLGTPAVPIILWVAAILVALAEIAAVAYVITRLAEIGGDTLVRIYQVHSNASRYDAELAMINSRFNACLRAGGTPQDCAQAIPIPRPINENVQLSESDAWTLGFAALGVTGAIGGLIWAGYKLRARRHE